MQSDGMRCNFESLKVLQQLGFWQPQKMLLPQAQSATFIKLKWGHYFKTWDTKSLYLWKVSEVAAMAKYHIRKKMGKH